ncbi:MAG: COX15/CtaA family protein, partial [Ginsengibacter sp.]
YTFWFALSFSVKKHQVVVPKSLRTLTAVIGGVLFIQLVYGAFMAGLHAAVYAPTWPKINGQWIPTNMNNLSPAWINILENRIAIHFIHRGLAYILVVLVMVWWYKVSKIKTGSFFNKTKWMPSVLILLQAVLGIFTVLLSPFGNNLVYFGVAHQWVAMLFLMSLLLMWYLMIPKSKES